MHLLCTLAWSLILLPLGFCCKSQKSREDIAMDYSRIIQRRIEGILSDIDNELNGTCRPVNRSELNVSTHILSRVLCRHSQTDFCHMSPQVKILTGEVQVSLGCSCKEKAHKKDEKNRQWHEGGLCQPHLRLQRKLCILKHWLERIKDLYSQFLST